MTFKSPIFLRVLIPHALLCFVFCCTACLGEPPSEERFAVLRQEMVRQQIEKRGVADQKVLTAMRTVERHRFVPEEYAPLAYSDSPLPIGHGQTISQPYIVAFMTQALALTGTEKVLEIGTGSGYQAAILAGLSRQVFTVEIHETLGRQAQTRLAELGYKNVQVRVGDGYQGWKEQSPFDAIIVTCAPSHIPKPLREQLAEGGKMIIPVGEEGVQELILLTKEKGRLVERAVLPVRFVPMVQQDGKSY